MTPTSWLGGYTQLSTPLRELMMSDWVDIGTPASYQLCKIIYEYHPLGRKMVDSPVMMAQSQSRNVSIQLGPEEVVRERFLEVWDKLNADFLIATVIGLSRTYGCATVSMLIDGEDASKPLDLEKLAKTPLDKIAFNCFDPLNTSGSLVTNQNPNAFDFMKSTGEVTVQGTTYHRSRNCVLFNERPIYIGYTTSAFGYVGRSVYQRALYPLKTFLQTMITDDMVSRKAGVLVAKIKAPGSIIDGVMNFFAASKRNMIKEAENNNVVSCEPEEDISSLDLTNIEGAAGGARKNAIENIATAGDMPAKILLQETFAEGFGEGTEDAKYVARYVDGVRKDARPVYDYFDRLVMRLAWTEQFYESVKADYDLGGASYDRAFTDWSNSFAADWPSLLKEPESEEVQVDKVKFEAIAALLELLMPKLDPVNAASMIQWAADNFNERKLLFTSPLTLDYEALEEHLENQPQSSVLPDDAAESTDAGDEGAEHASPPRPRADAYAASIEQLKRIVDDKEGTARQRVDRVRAAKRQIKERVG